MKPKSLAALFGVGLFAVLAASAGAQTAINEQEAQAIGVDAYLYLYPLVIMDVTRKQSTNIEPGKEFGKGPMNAFTNMPSYPPADVKIVVRLNFNTLYSVAWLDLTKEPMIVSAPNTDGRYYLLPMLDMWTDVFASPGWRTTGTQAGSFLVTPPGWRPDLRDGFIVTPSALKRRRLSCGSSAEQGRMGRRTTMQFTKSKQVIKSRHSRSGVNHQSQCK